MVGVLESRYGGWSSPWSPGGRCPLLWVPGLADHLLLGPQVPAGLLLPCAVRVLHHPRVREELWGCTLHPGGSRGMARRGPMALKAAGGSLSLIPLIDLPHPPLAGTPTLLAPVLLGSLQFLPASPPDVGDTAASSVSTVPSPHTPAPRSRPVSHPVSSQCLTAPPPLVLCPFPPFRSHWSMQAPGGSLPPQVWGVSRQMWAWSGGCEAHSTPVTGRGGRHGNFTG